MEKSRLTLSGEPLNLRPTPAQNEIFWEQEDVRYTVVPKGRRLGATHGAFNFVLETMLSGKPVKILWIDTVYSNIDKYLQRYALPSLKKIKSEYWSWKLQAKELRVCNGICDFRSADRPENIEGFAYDIIILNEAGIILQNRYLWQTTVRPMCLDYQARVWFIGTPKGKTCKRDGKEHEFYTLYKRGQDEDYPNWRALHYSTYDNPLLNEDDIREAEEEVPGPIQQQEIHGEFIDIGSEEVFHRDWFKILNHEPPRKGVLQVMQSWDTAFKKGQENDYSVCTTWYITSTEYICVDLYHERVEFPELLENCKKLYEKWDPDLVLIEDKASGQSLIQTIRNETRMPLKAVRPDKDKYSRACAVSNTVAAGNVHLVDSLWTKTMLDEMSTFPSGHDDIVDTVVQLLENVKHTARSKEPIVQRKIVRSSKVLQGYSIF